MTSGATLLARGPRQHIGAGLLISMALTLAVLNPLACIVHCVPRGVEPALLIGSGPAFAFLCHVPFSAPHVAAETPRIEMMPTTAMPGAMPAPQAVYPCVLVALLLLQLIRVARRLVIDPISVQAQARVRPQAPPPKTA